MRSTRERRSGSNTEMTRCVVRRVIWLSMGILFGVLSAWRAGRWLDRGLTVLALIGVSMPVFFLGAVLSYYIGDKLGWLPPGDYVSLASNPWEWLRHMILPWFALS